MKGIFKSGSLLLMGTLLAQTGIAATHTDVTPYDQLQTRLPITEGMTYLNFMQTKVYPSLNFFEKAITAEETKFPNQYAKWQTDLIAAGDGVAVRINPTNYIFNIGYHDGSQLPNDVKSGRSYGVGPTGLESDPSDEAYLTELAAFYKSEPQHIGDFLKAILSALTNCDVSGWDKLSDPGQIVATDFVAIYTAESDRHLMVSLAPAQHPWEIDLGAATLVSVYVNQTGKIMKNDSLMLGDIGQWWAKGTNGSGIGETRKDRIALQKLIATYESKNDPSSIKQVTDIIGSASGDDVIQGFFQYLNNPSGPKKLAPTVANQLVDAMVQYIANVQANAKSIQ